MKKPIFLMLSLVLVVLLLSVLFSEKAETTTAAPQVIAIMQLTDVDNLTVAGFQEAMTKLGYREGREVVYLNSGVVGRIDRLEDTIRSHLLKQPDLIFVSSTPATLAVKRLTEARQQPPVVFAPVNDPLHAGIVTDLRQPGGHITGIRLPTGDDLRLKWLLRIAPTVKRIYLPYSVDDESALTSLQRTTVAANALGVTLLPQPVATQAGGAQAIAALPHNADAIFLPRDSRIEADIAAFVALAEQRRLPLSAPSLAQVQAGALFSYGFVHQDIGRQAAHLADQILRQGPAGKGLVAGDLPIEMAENKLAINLAAAGRIGIVIPDDIVRQAEYLIRE